MVTRLALLGAGRIGKVHAKAITGDAQAHTFCEDEEARFDMHERMVGRTPTFVSPQIGKTPVHL